MADGADWTITLPAAPAASDGWQITPPKPKAAQAPDWKIEPPAGAPGPIERAVKLTASALRPGYAQAGEKALKAIPDTAGGMVEQISGAIQGVGPAAEREKGKRIGKADQTDAGLMAIPDDPKAPWVKFDPTKHVVLGGEIFERAPEAEEMGATRLGRMLGAAAGPGPVTRLAGVAEDAERLAAAPKVGPKAAPEPVKPRAAEPSPLAPNAGWKIEPPADAARGEAAAPQAKVAPELPETPIPRAPAAREPEKATVSEIRRLRAEAQATDDKLFSVQSNNKADIIESLNRVKALPPELKNPAVAEKMYLHTEEPNRVPLTPDEKALYDTHVKPLLAQERSLYQERVRRGIAPNDIPADPNYVHQIPMGKEHPFDTTIENQGALGNDPRYGSGRQAAGPSVKEQQLVTLVGPDGKRVISRADMPGYKVEDDVAGEIPAKRLRVGQTVKGPDGKFYKVERSFTREKEEAFPGLKYHKNIIANTEEMILQHQRALRMDDALEGLKADLVGKDMLVKQGGNREIPPDWVSTSLPQFAEWKMPPRIAHVLDDFHKEGFIHGDLGEMLAKVNRVLTQAIFLNPISAEMGHGMNVAVQWFTSRGWDNFNPGTWQRSAYNGVRALKDVNTLNENYVKLLRESSALRYSSAALAHNYETMLKALGENVNMHAKPWKEIATSLGVRSPLYLIRKLADTSSRGLWWTQDVLMLQRVYDLMDTGKSMPEAIKEAERVIPNYRVPSSIGDTVLPGKVGAKIARGLAQASKERAILLFQPWHYSLMKSMGTILKGAVKGNVDDLGKLVSLMALTYGVFNVVDYGLKKAFGQDAYLRRAGLAEIPYKAWQALTHQIGVDDVASAFFTESPVIEAARSLGKNIAANIPEHPARAAVEAVNTAVNSLSPLEIANGIAAGRQTLAQAIEQMFGIQQHGDRQKRGQRVGEKERTSTSKYLYKGSKHFPKNDPVLKGARKLGIE